MAIHEFVTAADVLAFRPSIDEVRLSAFITAANAQATVAAPGIAAPEFLANEAAMESLRHVLRGAILRWDDLANGNSAATTHQRSAGPLQESVTTDTRQPGGFNLWPSEVSRIRGLVTVGGVSRAFTINTTPSYAASAHSLACDTRFGVPFCSCGLNLTAYRFPLYDEPEAH